MVVIQVNHSCGTSCVLEWGKTAYLGANLKKNVKGLLGTMRNWNDNSATPSLGRIEDSVLFYLVMYCYLLSFPFQESGQLLLSGENNTYLWVYVSNWNHSFQKIFTPHPPPHQGPNLEAFSWIPRVGFSWLMGTLYGYKTMELNHVVSTITPHS